MPGDDAVDPQARYQLYLLSLPNLTGMPVTCTANSNLLKQILGT